MGADDSNIVPWGSLDWTPEPFVQDGSNELDGNENDKWDPTKVELTTEERHLWFGLSKKEIEDEERAERDWNDKRRERDAEWIRQKAAMKPTRLLSTIEDVREVLPVLEACKGDAPRVVVDTEGFNDYRCECDIIEVYSCAEEQLFMFDTFTLGADMFDISTSTGFSLRTFLTSPEIPKIFWDVRQDANALWCSMDIQLAGVIDASLLVTRINMRKFGDADHRMGLESAIEQYLLGSRLISELEYHDLDQGKRERIRLGRPEVWTIRPLPECLIEYARDVRLIGILYEQWIMPHFRSEHQIEQRQQTLEFTEAEIYRACSGGYNRNGDNSSGSPWSSNERCTIGPVAEPDAELEDLWAQSIAARRRHGWRQDLSRYQRTPRLPLTLDSVVKTFKALLTAVIEVGNNFEKILDNLADRH